MTVRKKTIFGHALFAFSCHEEGWYLVLLKYDSRWFGVLRAYPWLKVPLWVVHVSMLRSPDPLTTQIKSASLYWASKYAQFGCVSTWSSKVTQYLPIMCSGPVSLYSGRQSLINVHKDELEPSQALRTTFSSLHLWSCRVVTSMKCEATISLSRWVVQDPYPAVPGSRSGVSCPYR